MSIEASPLFECLNVYAKSRFVFMPNTYLNLSPGKLVIGFFQADGIHLCQPETAAPTHSPQKAD